MRILVVGQTPPPFGGQAVMIRHLVGSSLPGIELAHVQMNFSRDMNEMGQFGMRKIWHLFSVIWSIFAASLRRRFDALYFPPSGPSLLPVIRDVTILTATRWLFPRTIFHYHASGLSEYLQNASPFLRVVAKNAFEHPDLAITLGPSAPREGKYVNARREVIVPCGVADAIGGEITHDWDRREPFRILFVGMLSEDKGVLVAIKTVLELLRRGENVTLTCMGRWADRRVEESSWQLIDTSGYSERFAFPGVLTGDSKWDRFRTAHLFLFPSFFHSETFPLVLIEAMCASLPIVSTHWRAIPDVVAEGENAILVAPRDELACTAGILRLIQSDELRTQMARASRARFVRNFTIETHLEKMREAFLTLLPSATA